MCKLVVRMRGIAGIDEIEILFLTQLIKVGEHLHRGMRKLVESWVSRTRAWRSRWLHGIPACVPARSTLQPSSDNHGHLGMGTSECNDVDNNTRARGPTTQHANYNNVYRGV